MDARKLAEIEAQANAARTRVIDQGETLDGGPRLAMLHSENIEGWFVGYSPRNHSNCAEGPIGDWRALAEEILGVRADDADALVAEVRRLTAALGDVTASRDAYRRAKSENDERFMRERDEARDALAAVTVERDRLQRACDEGLPREYIECPACHAQHVEGARFDKPEIDGRTRPHHTHRCYACAHVWDSGRWSFGADVPNPFVMRLS